MFRTVEKEVLNTIPILKLKWILGLLLTLIGCCLLIGILVLLERANILLSLQNVLTGVDDDNDDDDIHDNNNNTIGTDIELELEEQDGDDDDCTTTTNYNSLNTNNNNKQHKQQEEYESIDCNNNDSPKSNNNSNNNIKEQDEHAKLPSMRNTTKNRKTRSNKKKNKNYYRRILLLPSQIFIIACQVCVLTLFNYLLLVFVPGGNLLLSFIGMIVCWIIVLKSTIANEIRRGTKYDKIILMITSFCIIASGLSLCTYSQLAIQEGHVYTGPAYIVGYDTSSYNNIDGETIRADLQVSWGGSWGCPTTYVDTATNDTNALKFCTNIDVSGALCETKYNPKVSNTYITSSSYYYDEESYDEQLYNENEGDEDEEDNDDEDEVPDGEYEEVLYKDKNEVVKVDENYETGQIDDVDVTYKNNGTESVQLTNNGTVDVTYKKDTTTNHHHFSNSTTNTTSSSVMTEEEDEEIVYNKNGTQQVVNKTITNQEQQDRNSTDNNNNNHGGGRRRNRKQNRRQRRTQKEDEDEGDDQEKEEEVNEQVGMETEIEETVVQEEETDFENDVYDAAYDAAMDAVDTYDKDVTDSEVTVEQLEQENEQLEEQNEQLEKENEEIQDEINDAEKENENLIEEETDMIEDEEATEQSDPEKNLYSYDDTIYSDDYWNYNADDDYSSYTSWNDIWGEYACSDLFNENLQQASHELKEELSPQSNYNVGWPTIQIYGNCNTCTAYLVDYYTTEHYTNIIQYQKQARWYLIAALLSMIAAFVVHTKQKLTPTHDSKMELLTSSNNGNNNINSSSLSNNTSYDGGVLA